MDFKESQRDMNISYIGGATGVLASGLIWGIAGIVGILASNITSMLTLFVGGMLIFPLSILFSKILKRSGKHDANNILKHLAVENLGILFVGLFLAFVMAQINQVLFFPVMLLIIGARYLLFQSLYGLKSYWFLGALLILAGGICIMMNLPFITGAFAGSVIEIVFAFILYQRSKSTHC